jgi:putative endonuclease
MYILRCHDASLYVGSTIDLLRRMGQHADGLVAYTRRRRPLELAYWEEFTRIDDAFAREKQVQGWGRAKRLALIDGFPGDLPALSRNESAVVAPAEVADDAT